MSTEFYHFNGDERREQKNNILLNVLKMSQQLFINKPNFWMYLEVKNSQPWLPHI